MGCLRAKKALFSWAAVIRAVPRTSDGVEDWGDSSPLLPDRCFAVWTVAGSRISRELRQRLDAALAAEAEANAVEVRHVEASVPQRHAEAQPFKPLPHILPAL